MLWRLLKLSTILLFSYWIITGFYHWQLKDKGDNKDYAVFTIIKGEAVEKIAEQLYEKKLIDSKYFFKLYVKFNDKADKFQAGDYALEPGMTLKETSDLLTSGKIITQDFSLLIREGLTINGISKLLDEKKVLNGQEFSKLAKTKISAWPFNFTQPSFLKDISKNSNLEGYLFPDTYRLYQNAESADLIKKMLINFDKKLTADLRQEIKKQNKSLSEIITMASIIEREVRSEQDMALVSGIFWNRLGQGMPLQSCATLAYVLGVNKPQYSLEDTKIESPYNTYRNKGLPPGPIANPGLKAIKAAINPAKTDYLFFLSRPDTGETVFSRNLDEHNRNKAKYLK